MSKKGAKGSIRWEMRWSPPFISRFPFGCLRRVQRVKEAFILHLFIVRGRLGGWAWGCLSLGASFHGGRLVSYAIAYLLERFDFWGGRIARLGRISCWETSSHQIAVRSVAEEIHSAELHYCGGVSRSVLTVCSWSRFSGFDSLYVGCTILGCTWRFWACMST